MELDRQFLCQFLVIRKAFFLKKENKIELNFHAVIDLTHILSSINCDLNDILNVYKFYHNRQFNISINEVIRADKIIENLGFDKHSSEYYIYSRNNIDKVQFQNCILSHSTNPSLNP